MSKLKFLAAFSFLWLAISCTPTNVPPSSGTPPPAPPAPRATAFTGPIPTATLPAVSPTVISVATIDMTTAISMAPNVPATPGAATATPGAPATAAVPPSVSTTPASGQTYVVRQGDTAYSIARRFGISLVDLARANQLADTNSIRVGQRLVIPGPETFPPVATATPTPTGGPVVTQTTATPTSSPVVSQPTATATSATGSQFDFTVAEVALSQNCNQTQVWGYVRDASDRPLANYRVRVSSRQGDFYQNSSPTDANGLYNVIIAGEPKSGSWSVSLLDSSGSQVSPPATFDTSADCRATDKGNQAARISFKKRS